MYFSFLTALALALLVALEAIISVEASLYVIKPQPGDLCHGGEECVISWLDDGTKPFLSSMGVVTIGLYTGHQQLVQTIDAVDVSKIQSLRFTPIPQAGPDSDSYYIAFKSTTFKMNGTDWSSFTPFFRLDGMSGSFSTPLDTATATSELPSSLTESAQSTPLSTITIGTLSTSSSASPSPTSNPTVVITDGLSSSSQTESASTSQPESASTSQTESISTSQTESISSAPSSSSPAAGLSAPPQLSESSGGGGVTLTIPPATSRFITSSPSKTPLSSATIAPQNSNNSNGAVSSLSVSMTFSFISVLSFCYILSCFF